MRTILFDLGDEVLIQTLCGQMSGKVTGISVSSDKTEYTVFGTDDKQYVVKEEDIIEVFSSDDDNEISPT